MITSSNLTRIGAALVGVVLLGTAGEAAAAPMSPMSLGASASQGQIEQVRYVRRHHPVRRHYVRRGNPGPAIAGAALGLIGAATSAAVAGSYYDNGPYGGGYAQPYYGGGYYGGGPGYYGGDPGYYGPRY